MSWFLFNPICAPPLTYLNLCEQSVLHTWEASAPCSWTQICIEITPVFIFTIVTWMHVEYRSGKRAAPSPEPRAEAEFDSSFPVSPVVTDCWWAENPVLRLYLHKRRVRLYMYVCVDMCERVPCKFLYTQQEKERAGKIDSGADPSGILHCASVTTAARHRLR